MNLWLIELLASILVIIGVVLLIIPSRKGIISLSIGQAFWVVFAILSSKWFLFSQSIFLILVNIFTIYNWKRKGVG